MKNESGQALLIAAFIFIVMIIAIPAIIFTNRMSSRHSVTVLHKTKSTAVAQEGLSFALVQLSSSTTLQSASQITPPPDTAEPPLPTPPVSPGIDMAFFVSQTVPRIMRPNENAFASVSFMNPTGTNWTDSTYRLRSRNPTNNNSWGITQVDMDPGDDIPQSSTKTFVFPITAPATPGVYRFQWGMENIGTGAAFGQYSQNVNVLVAPAPPAPANWPYLNGTGTLPPNGTYTSSQGGRYSIAYTQAPTGGLQPYQVGVLVTSLNDRGEPIPGGRLYAQVSPLTLSAKLPTGISASAALQLSSPPNYGSAGSNLSVYWGPVVTFFESIFFVSPWMDEFRTPRKFSINGITGLPGATWPTFPRSEGLLKTRSDQREYWAYADLGTPGTIDLAYYRERARNTNAGGTPNVLPNGWTCAPSASGCRRYDDSGYFFIAAGSTLTVTGPAGDWPSPSWTAPNENVLYFDGGMHGTGGGNVEVQNVAIDLRDKGAFIVTGNLRIGSRQNDSGLNLTSAPTPLTANLEIPYISTGTWPCINRPGLSCTDIGPMWSGTAATRPSIRGFIYVMGKMQVLPHTPSTAPNMTTLVGTLQVDGPIQLDPATPVTLSVYMDSTINHNIRTSVFDLQVDSMTVIP